MTPDAPRFELRTMAEADLPDGLRLSRAAGWNQGEADWKLLLALGPGLFLLAQEGGRAVACGGAVRYGEALAWVCMILVDPGWRGRGLGTAVFDAVLARLDGLAPSGGPRSIGLDATPAGRGLYERRGFVDAASLLRLRLEAAPGAPQPSDDVHPLTANDLDAVLAADLEAFGADRGTALRFALDTAPELAWVGRRPDRVAYCFGRHGDLADHVGPIVADTASSGRDLLAACLRHARPRPLIVDACEIPEWHATLAGLGFREQRPFTRMYRGGVAPTATDRSPAAAGRSAAQAKTLAVFGPELG